MNNNIIESLRKRRSHYALSNVSTLSEEQLNELLEQALIQTPSAFNSQTGRLVLLLNDKHLKVWDIVLETLKPLVSEGAFVKTIAKVDTFKKAHGTILFFEEDKIVKDLQRDFALYKDQFPVWSDQTAGMLNLVVWTALAEAGMGASLQHYNPLIDEEVKKVFNLPSTWRLIAQMPFGVALDEVGEKDVAPVATRYKVIG